MTEEQNQRETGHSTCIAEDSIEYRAVRDPLAWLTALLFLGITLAPAIGLTWVLINPIWRAGMGDAFWLVLPFAVFGYGLVAWGMSYILRVIFERIVIASDGIRYIGLRSESFIPYDQVYSVYLTGSQLRLNGYATSFTTSMTPYFRATFHRARERYAKLARLLEQAEASHQHDLNAPSAVLHIRPARGLGIGFVFFAMGATVLGITCFILGTVAHLTDFGQDGIGPAMLIGGVFMLCLACFIALQSRMLWLSVYIDETGLSQRRKGVLHRLAFDAIENTRFRGTTLELEGQGRRIIIPLIGTPKLVVAALHQLLAKSPAFRKHCTPEFPLTLQLSKLNRMLYLIAVALFVTLLGLAWIIGFYAGMMLAALLLGLFIFFGFTMCRRYRCDADAITETSLYRTSSYSVDQLQDILPPSGSQVTMVFDVGGKRVQLTIPSKLFRCSEYWLYAALVVAYMPQRPLVELASPAHDTEG